MSTLCIDFGNTRLKAAIFKEGIYCEEVNINNDKLSSFEELITKYNPTHTILASVIDHNTELEDFLNAKTQFHKITHVSKFNFSISVSKKETIGADRLALIAAACQLYPNRNNLIIGIGSCITYNFVNQTHQFLGGAISPGMEMRFKALKEYTSKLPLVTADWNFPLIGYDTKTNLQSGVIVGIINEINGFIQNYDEKYGNFNVVLTGGHSPYFASQLKNKIFADVNFLFKGLYALVKSITHQNRNFYTLIIGLFFFLSGQAQDNSPYSRYGMGDLVPGQNVVNKGMGGFSAAYSDFGIIGAPFNINLINPASLGNLSNTKNFSNTIFDIGTETSVRTLKSNTTLEKYKSGNVAISYLQVALPLSTEKMEKRGTSWGMSFGLKPLTKINYKVEENGRLSNIDSVNNLYEGNGGTNQVNISSGIRKIGKGKHKNEFSFGISTGYTFGNKDYSTRVSLINDSIQYYKANEEVQTRFGGVFLNTGLQYQINIKKTGALRFGLYANLQQQLSAKESTKNETFGYDNNGGIIRIDSVSYSNDVTRKIILPATFGGGFSYHSKNQNWLIGADYEYVKWSAYRNYGATDKVQDIWTVRAGVEYYPADFNSATNKYWNYVKYRTGFYYGPDYIKLAQTRNNYAVSFGTSMPLTTPRFIQSRGEYVMLNTAIEVGARGNSSTLGLSENFFRVNIGISMNARWFQKRSYD